MTLVDCWPKGAALLVSVFLSAPRCAPPPAATDSQVAEVAYKALQGPAFLFRVQNGKLLRTSCPAGTEIYDAAHCGLDPRRADLSAIYRDLEVTYGDGLAACQESAAATIVRLDRVEARLTQLLVTPSDAVIQAQAERLRRDISRGELDLANNVGAIAEIERQITAVESAIGQSPTGDLLAQLNLLRERNMDLRRSGAALRTTLGKLRDDLVNLLAAASDSQEFRELNIQRRELIARYEGQRRCVESELAERVTFARAMRMVAAGDFVYEHIYDSSAFRDTYPVVERLAVVFQRYDEVADLVDVYGGLGHMSASGIDDEWRMTVSIDVAIEGHLRGLACEAVALVNDYPLQCRDFVVKPPKGSPLIGESSWERELDLFVHVPTLKEYCDSVRGNWTVSMACFNAHVDPRIAATCKMTVAQ